MDLIQVKNGDVVGVPLAVNFGVSGVDSGGGKLAQQVCLGVVRDEDVHREDLNLLITDNSVAFAVQTGTEVGLAQTCVNAAGNPAIQGLFEIRENGFVPLFLLQDFNFQLETGIPEVERLVAGFLRDDGAGVVLDVAVVVTHANIHGKTHLHFFVARRVPQLQVLAVASRPIGNLELVQKFFVFGADSGQEGDVLAILNVLVLPVLVEPALRDDTQVGNLERSCRHHSNILLDVINF